MERKKKKNEAFYSIGEVSKRTGIKPYILRYWEKEFPFLQPIKNKVGHRLYTRRDIFIITNIKELLYHREYSISGAKKVLLNMLLGKKDNSIEQYIHEIRQDLYEMLEVINSNLE